MENKFKVGDRVRLKANGNLAQVVIAKDGWIGYDESRRFAGSCPMEEAEPIDDTTAFLSELKGLLEKYDAGIYVDFNQSDEIYTTTIAVGEDSVKYNYTDGIDCDNIMDYEKE